VSDAVEQIEEIAFRGIEREIANVKARRCDFNPFGFACRSRGLRPIARLCRDFPFLPAVAEKFGNPLPKRLFLCLCWFLLSSRALLISSAAGPTARAA
jgi:hypothetical protein